MDRFPFPDDYVIHTSVPISADLARALAESDTLLERFRNDVAEHLLEAMTTAMLPQSVKD